VASTNATTNHTEIPIRLGAMSRSDAPLLAISRIAVATKLSGSIVAIGWIIAGIESIGKNTPDKNT
jgi:hypothetical protein